ncbi:RDD family protein [Streptomyces sp. NBC_00102]|uniref:RDD family protein n=1 Tax=Streptomyces sp. NBC_00102 TaxID=2975652 RepID=UPI00224DC767|nr:RDD family protein [Streptomyces sp. NBC_00102]MCX5397396.1 RDD family protein [Streptomyces sp. NBC_00102]
MSDLVTGDAVVLELRPARLPSRALAQVIDTTLLLIVFTVLSIVLGIATLTLDDAAVAAVAVASFLLVLVGGPIAVETLSRGRSLGKLACGLRVVREDGGPIGFRHALVRGAMGVVEILSTFGGVAAVASLVSARGRRLGDVFAGTIVVRERVPIDRSRALQPPPPWLGGRFAQLDLSAVPDEFWLAARSYVSRLHQLDPAVAHALGRRLADELAARTALPAPDGVAPAAYVAAVLHERRVREARRFEALRTPPAGRPQDRAPGAVSPGAPWGVPAPVADGATGWGAPASAPVVGREAAPVPPVLTGPPVLTAPGGPTGFAPPA